MSDGAGILSRTIVNEVGSESGTASRKLHVVLVSFACDPTRGSEPAIGWGWAESLARRIIELMQMAGLPTTLSACGIGRGILPVLADEAAQQWTGRFNPRPAGEPELRALYESAL